MGPLQQARLLLFSDIPANVIDKWTPDGKVTTFLDKSGLAGPDPGDIGYQLNNGHKVVTLYRLEWHHAR